MHSVISYYIQTITNLSEDRPLIFKQSKLIVVPSHWIVNNTIMYMFDIYLVPKVYLIFLFMCCDMYLFPYLKGLVPLNITVSHRVTTQVLKFSWWLIMEVGESLIYVWQ